MLRVDLLINEARENTESSEYTSETGVQDSSFLRAFNDAQDKVMSLIHQMDPNLFEEEKLVDVVSGQEAYDVPVDLYAGTKIKKVEYSSNGDENQFNELDSGNLRERLSGQPSEPSFYIRRSNQLLIQPRPQGGGKLRVTYIRTIPRLDKRRGRLTAVTTDDTTGTISGMIVDPSLLTSDDVTFINQIEFLCVVSKLGVIKMKGIPIDQINSSTGAIDVEAGFAYEDGESAAIGDYIVGGKYTTTHSELPDTAERYLLKFAEWRVQKRDSSNDSREANEELEGMAADIVATYKKPDDAVQEIAILDTQFLDF